jgi:cell division protein FtsI (penicillin-binding protein 3)/stage V sporulation protein D (sporulation-specific penicillin-binding protein)
VSPKLANRRIRLLLAVLTLAAVVTFGRAFWLQVVRAPALERLAAQQHHETVTTPAGRGTIFDRMGVQLAIGEQATTVYADPRQIRNAQKVAVEAGHALNIDPNKIYPQLRDKKQSFVYVQRKADPARAAALQRKGLAGVDFYSEERRFYPQHTVAAQVLGYAGVDNNGLAGLELGLDRDLAGKPGKETIVRDPFGRTIDVVSSTPEQPGRDVFLTLDHTLQAKVESVLRTTVARWHALDGTAIVLDPQTGGVLAMAVAPGFDANDFSQVPSSMQRNRAVTDTYEPGSTFKVVTYAAALTDGVVNPNSSFSLPPSIKVADRTIDEAEPRPTETMTVAEMLARSSNVGTVMLAQLLGSKRLAGWINRFGFGRPTGIDFPGESPGIVLPLMRWSGSTIGNVPIGQGIAVTPIQMAAMYGALANHGIWVQPHLVDHVRGRRLKRPARHRILSTAISREVISMLQGVVSDGTGEQAAVPGYLVAGKTGTAAKPDSSGGYSDTRYVASFVGIVPASAPRLVVLVSINEPQGQIFGGVVAAPAFRDIARFALQYLDVPPDDVSTLSSQNAGASQSG